MADAVRYLLVRQLNSAAPAEGQEGHDQLREAFLSLIGTSTPSVFFDIGANDGSTSVAVREMAPDCAVHAFEANPTIFAKHSGRLVSHGVQPWNLAVGRTVGSTTIYAPLTLSKAYIGGEVVAATVFESEDTGKTSLLRRDEEATYQEFDVDATTLDAFVERHVRDWRERRFFLWVDVEGAADQVLAGGRKRSFADERDIHRNRGPSFLARSSRLRGHSDALDWGRIHTDWARS